MANGKELQKFKDVLDDKGCEQGRMRELRFIQYEKNVNGIGKRITIIMRWLIIVAIILIADMGTKMLPLIIKAIMGG